MVINLPSNIDFTKLSDKYIYFGHQSLGANILNGIQEIINIQNNGNHFSIISPPLPKHIDSPALYHSYIGTNLDPLSKINAFKNIILNEKLGKVLDIAFFKFCYVDIKKDSDIKAIFTNYKETIEEIQFTYPNLRIIHFTAPIKAHQIKFQKNLVKGMKYMVKNKILGDLDNVKRNQYNQIFRGQFDDNGNLFDLAELECQNNDNTEANFKYGNKNYSCLSIDLTDDGGHLNHQGQLKIGSDLLKFLIKIVTNN